MKLRIPFGCGAISHAGDAIEINPDGYVDVMEHVAYALLGHGFVALPESETVHDVSSPSPKLQPSDDIARLNRPALFAFLKAKGVGVSLPVTNDELRRMARSTVQNEAFGMSDETMVKG